MSGSAPFLASRDRPGVLYVMQHNDWSGAEAYSAPVMQADADPLLACPPSSGTSAYAERLGVPTVALEHRPLRHSAGGRELLASLARGFGSAAALRRVLRAHPERRIVYGTTIRSALIAGIAAAGLRRRVVWVIPDYLPPQPPLRWAVRLLALLTCRRAIAMSQGCADELAGRWPALRARTAIVPGATELDAAAAEAELTAPRAAIVGAISPTKRTDLAVEIAAAVAATHPEFELLVVGAAQWRDEDYELERALHERVTGDDRLAQAVTFTGRRPDVDAVLRGCRLLLHCRADEPFGLVMVEAMAAGLPVVAPRSGGAAEIVVDGETGLLYEPQDATDAAAAVRRLLDDPQLAREMGRRGRRRVTERFTVGRQVADTDRLLAEVATGLASPRTARA